MHWAIEVSIDALTVAMQDDSMHPRLNVGDELLVEPSAPPRPGSIVLARAPITGEHVVRVYVPLHPTDPRAPGFILRPINPNFAEIVATAATPGEIIGTVVARQEVL